MPMPVVNPLARELVFKIVYYGPGLGGKTTTLQHIHATTKTEHRGKMVSLATPVDRTLYFDFLPIRLPTARGMGVRLQLFTVPGQVYYNATRRLVLTGADGIVFVADSQRARSDANLESLANLNENLREHGRELQDVPHVIAYNKRDLYDVLSIEELERQLDKHRAPSFATCATAGDGVYETLDAIARGVIDDFERRNPEGRELVTRDLQVPEGGLTEALRGVDGNSVPVRLAASPPAGSRPSGVLSLTDLPRNSVGEDAARAVSPIVQARAIRDSQAAAARDSQSAALQTRAKRESDRSATHTRQPAAKPSQPDPESAAEAANAAYMEPTLDEPAAEATGLSFADLWPGHEQAQVTELELMLRQGRASEAVQRADELISRALAGAGGTLANSGEAPRDPALVVLLLGLDGRRYLAFRTLVRQARAGAPITQVDALSAYAFAVEVRLARTRGG